MFIPLKIFDIICLIFRLQTTKRVRPIRKTTGSRNPLRKLAMRDDIQQQYEEVQAGIGERELKRLKRDQSE